MALTMGLVLLAKSQDTTNNSKRVQIEVEITEDGEKRSTTREFEWTPAELDMELNALMKEIEKTLDGVSKELEQADVEVIIRNNLASPGMHRSYRFSNTEPAKSRAFLGVVGKSLSSDKRIELSITHGVEIDRVVAGSAAEKAGLNAGDVIMNIDGKPVDNFHELAEVIRAGDAGREVEVECVQNGVKRQMKVTLGTKRVDDLSYHFEFDHPGLESRHFKGLSPSHRPYAENDEKRFEYKYRVKVDPVNEDELNALKAGGANGVDAKNALEVAHMELLPNPTEGVFVVDMGLVEKGDVEFTILNSSGKTVETRKIKGDADIVLERFDMTDSPSGMYYLSAMQNGKGRTLRLIKR